MPASLRSLIPVLLAVPAAERHSKGRAQVRFLSAHARRALAVSAEKTGLILEKIDKTEAGAPLPCNGVHWSVSHKPAYVAGVAAPFPIGIDVEHIRSYRKGLDRKVATDDEWALAPDRTPEWLFRFWTAKEAVLKAEGIGLQGLSKCRIQTITGHNALALSFESHCWSAHLKFFSNHVAAIAHNQPGIRLEWNVLDNLHQTCSTIERD